MTTTLGRAPDRGFSSLLLGRAPSNMPPALPPSSVIVISDDDDDDDDDEIHGHTQHFNFLPEHPLRPSATLASTLHVRPHSHSSPITRHDSKRQKLDDAPEASNPRSQHSHVHLDFDNSDDELPQAYQTFFNDAFLPTNRDNSSKPSSDTAAKILHRAALKEARRPPYFWDFKIKLRMYCGQGYQKFPLPVDYDQSFKDACDTFDAAGEDDTDQVAFQEPAITITQQDCLTRILEVFPDIQHKFVLDKIKSQHELIHFLDEEIEMHPDSAGIINEILEMDGYPKQADVKETAQDEFEESLGKAIYWKRDHHQSPNYKNDAVAMLATHFDHVPTHFIHSTVMQKGNMFDTYIHIEAIESDYFQRDRPYNRSKRPRVQLEKKYPSLDPNRDPAYYCSLVVELQAAKQQVLRKKLQSNQQQSIADAETANLEQQRIDGLLVQCKCCFDEEVPMNRTVVCLADREHSFCYDCVKNLAESQIGMKRYQLQCMDESVCSHILDNNGVGRAVPIKTFDRLQFNQQQAEIKAANIEGLEQCPLCDFQAICDPPEIDPVFSCQNPDCFKVTCRLCHEISHLPKTCEEMKKDHGLSVRHKIEEARTKAMIRTCPSCRSAIIKSDGCNKMRCTCGSIICYVCKFDLTSLRDAYAHFNMSSSTGEKCPLYDDKTIDRHVQETNAAEEKAIQEAKAQDSTIEDSTLRIETGKGKAINRKGTAPLLRGVPFERLANALGGHDLEENLNRLQRNQRLIEARMARMGDRAHGETRHDEMDGFLRDARHMRWLEDLRQRLPGAAAPRVPLFNGLQTGTLDVPGWTNPPTAPVHPFMHAYNQNDRDGVTTANAFGQTQNPPLQRPFGNRTVTNLGQNPLLQNQGQTQNQNQNQRFDPFGFPMHPQPNHPNIFNNAYANTAQRIHEARDQQDRRRRSRVERRDSNNNEAPFQAPNPNILNIRNNGNINNGYQQAPFQNHGGGLNLGMQPPAQNYLAAAYRPPARNITIADLLHRNDNNDNNTNTNMFAGFQSTFQFGLQPPAQTPQLGTGQNQIPATNSTRPHFPLNPVRTGSIQNGNGRGTVNEGIHGNGDMMARGRPNRRQTMPLDHLGGGAFEHRW